MKNVLKKEIRKMLIDMSINSIVSIREYHGKNLALRTYTGLSANRFSDYGRGSGWCDQSEDFHTLTETINMIWKTRPKKDEIFKGI